MTNDEALAMIEAGRKHDEAMRSTAPTCKCNGAAECEDWCPRASWDDAYCKADTWFEANHRVLLDGYAAALNESERLHLDFGLEVIVRDGLQAELDHATAHDGDHLSKASRRMVDMVMGDRDALRERVRSLEAKAALLIVLLGAIPDDVLTDDKIHRDEWPELFTDADGDALYLSEAKRRILEE